MVCLVGASGCGGLAGGDPPPKGEPEVVELRRVAENSVTSVAVTDEAVYWTDLVQPGVFSVDRGGKDFRQVAGDQGPDALSAVDHRLYWLSYADVALDVLQLSSAESDGADRRNLATGTSTELASHLTNWRVPTDANFAYWHALDQSAQISAVHATPRQGGESEVLFEVPGRVWQTWLHDGALHYSDNSGIYAFDLAARSRRTLVEQAFEVRDPVFVGDALYFIGFPREEPLRDGLFRVRDGTAILIRPGKLTISQSRIAAEDDHLFLVDNSTSAGARLVEISPDLGDEREIQTFREHAGSNLVAAGEHLIFATTTRIYSVRKDATPER